MTSPLIGPRPELSAWLALRRVHRGGVAKIEGDFYDRGRPMPGHVKDALARLVGAGYLVLVGLDQARQRRVTSTGTGQARYLELCERFRDCPRFEAPPDPDRPPAEYSHGSPLPVAGRTPAQWGASRLRWGRCPDDGRLHALEPADVVQVGTRGYAECRCGHKLPPDAAMEDGPSGALCVPCIVGVTSDLDDPSRMDTD